MSHVQRVRSGDAQGFLAQGPMFRRSELLQVFQFDLVEAFETPERPETEIVWLLVVHGDLRQLRREGYVAPIQDLLPCGVNLPGVRSVEMG